MIVAYTLFAKLKLHRLLMATRPVRLMLKYLFNLWIKSLLHHWQNERYILFLKKFLLSCGALLRLMLLNIWGQSASWRGIPGFASSISDREETWLTCKSAVVILSITIKLRWDAVLGNHCCIPVLSESKFLWISRHLYFLLFQLCDLCPFEWWIVILAMVEVCFKPGRSIWIMCWAPIPVVYFFQISVETECFRIYQRFQSLLPATLRHVDFFTWIHSISQCGHFSSMIVLICFGSWCLLHFKVVHIIWQLTLSLL